MWFGNRAAGDETARPYPGLSAFQEEDAEFFYGRELEVEALWRRLQYNGMSLDLSWTRSAKAYAQLYDRLDGWYTR